MGCLRLLFFQLWKVLLAALVAVVFTRIDSHVESRYPDSAAGKAWRTYRRRGKEKPQPGQSRTS
jgi:protein-S-isoprenylcysteine O-methyltransferase Ste14